MTKSRPGGSHAARPLARIGRPLSLIGQVEAALRQAIADGTFPSGKLPTEVELAEQLGVSRETVRLAAEVLQNEGLLVKIRHRGTFTRQPTVPGRIRAAEPNTIGYLQADFLAAEGQEEVANRSISGLMLQGALAEACRAGLQLVVRNAPSTGWHDACRQLTEAAPLRGLICASYGEEKTLRRLAARVLPTVLLDEETTTPGVHSIRDDCAAGAREAVLYLARLGHRRIAYAHWSRVEMNRWRPMGYRQGLREAGLPRRQVWEIPTQLTEPGARAMIEQLAALSPPVTALYCFNNTLAVYAVAELRRRGVRVPEDVSVLGGGGEEVPGLTCHQADWYEMGRAAVQVVLRNPAAHGRTTGEHLVSPHTLRTGQTAAAPGERSTSAGRADVKKRAPARTKRAPAARTKLD